MNHHNKITQEMEKIEIPKELHDRIKLGIQQAKKERVPRSRKTLFFKIASITAASLIFAVAVGMAASPTFANMVKSWFSLNQVDGGLKKAADEGYAEPLNKKVTDQGITLHVKEVVHDALRMSVLYGIEQDGKPLNSDLLFETFIPNGPDDDPYVNQYQIVDNQGKVLPLHLQQSVVGDDRILTFSLDDLVPGFEVQSLSDLPDQVVVRFDINQIGKTRGKWHLDVPIDLTKAKSSTVLIPLNQRYVSPLGFSINFNQLRHGSSKSELLLEKHETQSWRSSRKIEPQFRYEIRDSTGTVVAAHDDLSNSGLGLENINIIDRSGMGESGHVKYRHAFMPFEDAKDLKLFLTAIYTQEHTKDEFVVNLNPEALTKEPHVQEMNGKSVTFKARLKTDEAPELLKDGRQAFQGKGWVLEADQQLGSDTLDVQWRMKDEQGKLMDVATVTELVKDDKGNYRNRTLFFFAEGTPLPDQITMSFDTWTKKTPVNWSFPLVPSTDSLPPIAHETIYEMTVEELKPEIVRKAEQALQELGVGKPVTLYGATDYSDRWFLYTRDDSGSIVIVEKATEEPIVVKRIIPYSELDAKLQQTAEETLQQMEPGHDLVFEEAIRYKSKTENRWIIQDKSKTENRRITQNEQFEVIIDAATGKVEEASLSYAPEQVDAKIKAAAEQAYNAFSQDKDLKANTIKKRKTPQKHVWELYQDNSLAVQVGVRTNQVLSVEQSYKNYHPGNESEARKQYATPFYTEQQAIAKISPLAKQVLNIDLGGYEVSVELNEYMFTKKGSEAIKGTVNSKGDFWRLEMIPIEGIQD